MSSLRGPSLRELAVQALSSVEGGYDLLAPKFDRSPFRTPDAVLDATAGVLRPLGPFGRGLDVCCGTGAGIGVLSSLCQGPVTGVDFSAGMLEQARGAHPQARWVRADARALPFAEGFDLAVSFGAYGHFLPAERQGLFAGVYRALRPGGVFAFPVGESPPPTSRWYWALLGFDLAMRVRNAVWRPPFVMYYRTWPLPAVGDDLTASGFTVTTVPLTALGLRRDGRPRGRLVLARKPGPLPGRRARDGHVDHGRPALYQGAMDEPLRDRDPESYFGAGIGGGSGLFTAGGTPDGRRSPGPAAPSVATVTEPAREIPVHEETDVLVVGGGPAGTAAAVAARRLGQRVTLVERYGDLGGLSAGGLVIWIDRMTDWEGTPVIAGIGAELLDRLPAGALAGPGPELWGSTEPGQVAYWQMRLSAFRDTVCRSPMIDPEWLKIVSHEFLVGEGVRVLLHSWVVAAISDEGPGAENTVRGVIFESKQGRRAILAKVVVDATGDLDVIAQAGGEFVTDARKDGTGGNVQHTINTAFTWTGVDMGRWLEFKRDDPAAHHALMNRGRELLGYLDTPHVGWRDDVVVFMGPRLSGYSGLDVEHLSTVELESRRRMVAHLDFFRREAPGFENAWIMLAAPQIGIRMTRRLAGLHPMTTDDWKAGVRHPDEVGVSPSPSQQFPTISVPYRALVPQRLDGVVVGGRHVASDAATQAFMREIPQCWMTGQAAGTAAGLAARAGLAPRALDVEELRKELRRQGAFLHEP